MKEVITSCRDYNRIAAVMWFSDFKKASDSVKRTKLSKVLEESNVSPKLIGLVNMMLKLIVSNMRVRNETLLISG